MTNNSNESIKPETVHKIIIEKNTSNAFGIASFIFGVISIFFLAPVFVPLSLLFGIIAIISKQLAWGIMGIICAMIGFMTSPILLGIFGLITIASSVDSNSINSTPHNTTPIVQESSLENQNNQIIEQRPQIHDKTKESVQAQESMNSANINSDDLKENAFIKPSFDCSKAGTFIEKTICSNQELATLDGTMANLYKNAILDAINPEEIKKEQRSWLKNNRDKCLDIECLKQEYHNRIDALNSSFDKISQYTLMNEMLPDGKHPVWIYYEVKGKPVIRITMPTLDLCGVMSDSKSDNDILNNNMADSISEGSDDWNMALDIWKTAFNKYMLTGTPTHCK